MKQIAPQFSRRSSRWIGALVMSFALALLIVVVPRTPAQDVPELPQPNGAGDTPEIVVPMFQGMPLKLSSLRGRVVILDFFLSTCPHCQQHAPHMAELYNQFRARGFTIIGLAGDSPEQPDNLKAYIRDMKIAYPIGFRTAETVAYYVDSHDHGVPQIVLFGANGKMVRRWIGWGDETGKELTAAVQEQVQKMPAAKANGRGQ